jgi:general secretion pathway protein L
MSRKVLGLEIRNKSIAAVLLSSGFKGSFIENQGYFPIPEGAAENDEGLKSALQSVVDTLKPVGVNCVLGIPTSSVSFRNISVPFNDLKKIRQILPFELEPTLPTPVEALIFDFEAVKQDGQQDLLIFSVDKMEIKKYLDLLESVALRPTTIMPNGYAAAKFLSRMRADNEDALFIDTGDGIHTIYAISSGKVRLARTLPVAGGGNPILKNLETVLERTFTAFQASSGGAVNPACVYSTGPQAALLSGSDGPPQIKEMPVTSIDAIRNYPRLKGSLAAPDWAHGHLDVALSLALMEIESVDSINFSTERSTIQHFWSEYRRQIILSAVLIVFALLMGLGGQFLAVRAKARQLVELDRQIETVFTDTFPDAGRVVNPLQQMKIKIDEMQDESVNPETQEARVRVIDILNALSQRIPSSINVNIKRMVVGVDNVVLSGSTDNFNTVDEVKAGLEKSEIFDGVTISSADLEKSGKQVRFKLKLEF